MRTRTKQEGTAVMPRMLDTDELRAYTNLGRNGAMKLGEEAGAKVQFGKRVMWDKVKLDQYFDEITGA